MTSLLYTGERPYGYDMSYKAFVDTCVLKVHHCVCTGDHPCLCDVCNKIISHKCIPMSYLLSYCYQDPKSCDVWKSFIMVHCDMESALFTNVVSVSLSLGNFRNFFYCALV